MKNTDRKNELFTNAMSNLMKDKLGVSIDLLNELIEADSEDKLAFLARGSVYLKMSDTKNAIDDFSRALESALEDMKMVNHLSNLNIESFANENNVWRSRQLQLGEAMESEMHR